jgi:hypothetical protein
MLAALTMMKHRRGQSIALFRGRRPAGEHFVGQCSYLTRSNTKSRARREIVLSPRRSCGRDHTGDLLRLSERTALKYFGS